MEEEEEDEDQEDDLLHTSKEQFRMITQLISIKFTILKSDYGWTDRPTDGRTHPLVEMF